MEYQASLFTAEAPAVDASFGGLIRHQLDVSAWIDEVPGWVSGADALFATLVADAKWESRERWMYDTKVVEPRLTATWKHLNVPVIDDMRRALSVRYGVEFDRGGLNFYRNGRDSVAWHRDRIPKEVNDPIVAIVTLGEGRDFLVRPHGGGKSVKFTPAGGDVLVTGGTMQRRWEHAVPKRALAGPRMSITFRHGFADPDDRL